VGAIDIRAGYGRIISVSIQNVSLPQLKTGELSIAYIFHAPMSEDSLDRSVDELFGTKAVSDGFSEGYTNWLSSLDSAEAGIFTISVADIIKVYHKGLG
jgi:hypothetical protein